ncbi:MAG: EAL domain-containing protein [Myxococcales bacterium]|nr:EAL domain-containing protein [Myxococcales bacterium]
MAVLLQALRGGPNLLIITDLVTDEMVFVSDRVARITGHEPAAVEHHCSEELGVLVDPGVRRALAERAAAGEALEGAVLRLRHLEGHDVLVVASARRVDVAGHPFLVTSLRPAGSADRTQAILGSVAPHVDLTLWRTDLATRATERYAPWGPEAGPMEAFVERIEPADRPRLKAAVQGATLGGEATYAVQVRERGADGQVRPVQVQAVIHRDSAGIPVAFSGVNLGNAGVLARSRDRGERFVTALVEALDVAVVGLDARGRVRVFNESAARLTGWPYPEIIYRSWFEAVVPEGRRAEVQAGFARASQGKAGPHELEQTLLTRSGAERRVQWRITALGDGEDWLAICVGVDVTEERAARTRLEQRVSHDHLTGLLNRAGLLAELGRALGRARRGHQVVAVHLLDLDRFKPVNDAHGHAVGDALLMAVADRLLRTVRAGDRVARMSGDEFVVVQMDPAPHEATALAARLVDVVAEPLEVASLRLTVGTSVGLALSGESDETAEALLGRADTALYRAKQEGRGRFCSHDAALAAKHTARTLLTAELDALIARGGPALHWLPVIDLHTGAVLALEALARWPEPARAEPAEFILLAEQTGQMEALGLVTQRAVVAAGRQWRAAGLAVPTLVLNLTATELASPSVERRITSLLAGLGWPPGALELDLAARAWQTTHPWERARLAALASAGAALTLDDVGDGPLPLDLLEEVPLTRLKLGQAFIARGCSSALGQAAVHAVVGLARAVGAMVVAEGVETAAQAAALTAAGCQAAQGFWLQRPLPTEAVPAWLADRARRPPGPPR